MGSSVIARQSSRFGTSIGTDVRMRRTARPARPGSWCDDAPMTDSFAISTLLRLPRLSSLRLSPDGTRLVVAVGGVAPDGTKMTTSLWQVDPADRAPARRLTRSVEGEGAGVAFLPDGSLLFASVRPDPDAKPDPEKKVNALWCLPADGRRGPDARGARGRRVRHRDRAAARARWSSAPAIQRGARDFAGDAERTKARKEAGVEALLFDDYPIRHWDHYLGPRLRRLYARVGPGRRGPDRRPARPRARRRPGSRSTSRTPTSAPTGRSSWPSGASSPRSPRPSTTSSATTSPAVAARAADERRRRLRRARDRARRPLGRGRSGSPTRRRPSRARRAGADRPRHRRAADAGGRDRPPARAPRLGPRRLGALLHRRRRGPPLRVPRGPPGRPT